MPRRHALTEAQLENLLALPTTEAELVQYWTLGDEDLAIIGRRRRAHTVPPSSGATDLRSSHTSLLAPHSWTQVHLDILLEAFSKKAFSEKACALAAFLEHGLHWPAGKSQALGWLPSRRLNFWRLPRGQLTT